MATAPRINVLSGLSGNVESGPQNQANIKNAVWRNKWYPNKSINEMKAMQEAKRQSPNAAGAYQFIKLQPAVRETLINTLRRDPQLLSATVRSVMPIHSPANRQGVTRYLALQRNAILADPRLQGGARTKKLRRGRRNTRR